MTRLIDADALEERFRKLEASALAYIGKLNERQNPEEHETWVMWTAILNERTAYKFEIVDAPTVDAKPVRWILLSEKIPEMDERVVVTTHGYDFHIWDCMSNRGDNYFWEDEEGLYHSKYEVLAWLPLPEVML